MLIAACIEGSSRDRGGYAQVFRDGTCRRAHRWAVEQIVGPLPRRLEVHHLCENRACINVLHLDILDRAKHRRLHQAGKPCRRGHPDDHDKWGNCRSCQRERRCS